MVKYICDKNIFTTNWNVFISRGRDPSCAFDWEIYEESEETTGILNTLIADCESTFSSQVNFNATLGHLDAFGCNHWAPKKNRIPQ